jgi:hypothetical protein
VSPNETTAPSGRRHGRRIISSGAAIVLGTLLVGGVTTYAAATVSANSQLVSLGGSPTSGVTASQASPTTAATITTSAAPVPTVQSAESTNAVGSPGVAAKQTIGIAVLPGPLTVTPATESVPLTQLAAFGRAEPDYVGALSPITVDDARGSLVGWRSTVSLEAVSGLDAAQLASTRLCVTPHPTTLVAGNPADIVRSSPRACAGPGGLLTVFFAAPGGGGGEYSDTAGVALVLPNGTVAANRTATLAVAVS